MRLYGRLGAEVVTVDKLEAATGASPAAIRAALLILRAEGLVEPHRRGWRRTQENP